ncbi:tRNA (adenosine(37)-N6)-dimethylallyltransferase MiaA [soil metagenome]
MSGVSAGRGDGTQVGERPTVLCLAGPTASGKSAAAMAIAARWPAEIISVDSAQVYRGMDIGTAKPTAAERAAVPHHLIDLIEPNESYSAARFALDARALIDEIRARGRLAVLVGGTMLYFKALWNGLDEIPAADPETRARIRDDIDREALALGWPAMHEALAVFDPITAARLAPNDAQRIQRATEVWRSIGQPLSAFHSDRLGTTNAPPADMLLVSLEPVERSWLHRRIERRFDAMMDAGLLDEVRRLRARPELDPTLPALRCVGYRQLLEAFDRGGDPPPTPALDRAVIEAKAATRQLCKRQLTWLRSMPDRRTVACDAPDAIERVLKIVDMEIAR